MLNLLSVAIALMSSIVFIFKIIYIAERDVWPNVSLIRGAEDQGREEGEWDKCFKYLFPPMFMEGGSERDHFLL